jgi:hypothetical protein
VKTEYRIWSKPRPTASYEPGDLYGSLDAAKAATGFADTPWATNGEGNHWPEAADLHALMFIGTEGVPESIEDRVQLAVDLIARYGQIDGAHHKTWVLDQVVRVLTGDRYEQVIADYCAGEYGPETYGWDEGIAP